MVDTYRKFNNIKMLSEFVKIIDDSVGENLGKLITPDGVVTDSPAIIIGRANNIRADYPRITLTWQGNNDNLCHTLERGWLTLTDPTDPLETVEVPYVEKYVVFGITLTCESGAFSEVLSSYVNSQVSGGEPSRLSSDDILSKLRGSFGRFEVKKQVNDSMDSSLQLINPINPVPQMDETEEIDASTMTVFFNTTSVDVDYDGGVFDSIEVESQLFRISEEDSDPLESTRSVPAQP